MILKILWRDDDSNSIQSVASLLDADFAFSFEPYEDGRSAPKAKGSSYRRLYAEAIARGPYAATEQGGGGVDEVIDIHYKEGALDLIQSWTKRTRRSSSRTTRGPTRGSGRARRCRSARRTRWRRCCSTSASSWSSRATL